MPNERLAHLSTWSRQVLASQCQLEVYSEGPYKNDILCSGGYMSMETALGKSVYDKSALLTAPVVIASGVATAPGSVSAPLRTSNVVPANVDVTVIPSP